MATTTAEAQCQSLRPPIDSAPTEYVLNVPTRLQAAPVPETVATVLELKEAPRADTGRFDTLSASADSTEEDRHACGFRSVRSHPHKLRRLATRVASRSERVVPSLPAMPQRTNHRLGLPAITRYVSATICPIVAGSRLAATLPASAT